MSSDNDDSFDEAAQARLRGSHAGMTCNLVVELLRANSPRLAPLLLEAEVDVEDELAPEPAEASNFNRLEGHDGGILLKESQQSDELSEELDIEALDTTNGTDLSQEQSCGEAELEEGTLDLEDKDLPSNMQHQHEHLDYQPTAHCSVLRIDELSNRSDHHDTSEEHGTRISVTSLQTKTYSNDQDVPNLAHSHQAESHVSKANPAFFVQEKQFEDPVLPKDTDDDCKQAVDSGSCHMNGLNVEELQQQKVSLDRAHRRARSIGIEQPHLLLGGANLESCERRTSSCTPHHHPRSAETQSRRMIQELAHKVRNLEEMLLEVSSELNGLQDRLPALIQEMPLHVDCDGSDSPVARWKSDCRSLSYRLEKLAANALECSCTNRNMFAAMDVYEQANAAVENIADLLGKCADAEIEAAVPKNCDKVEWRIVAKHVSSSELESLRALTAQVQGCPVLFSGTDLRPLHEQPTTLLRFLRAQDGNVPAAAKAFRASMQWHAGYRAGSRLLEWSNELATCKTWRAKLVSQYRVHQIIGRDHYGLPVYLFRWSAFDIAGAERELGTEFVLQVLICIHEEIVAEMRSAMFKTNIVIPGTLYVWDIGDYGKKGVPQWWGRMYSLMRFLPKVAPLLSSNYPEVVRRIMVIRSGMTTKTLYHVATSFLPAKTLGKCTLYGWRASEWVADLFEELEEGSKLPAFLQSDDDEAIALAEPKGGLYPMGAANSAKLEVARENAAGRSDF